MRGSRGLRLTDGRQARIGSAFAAEPLLQAELRGTVTHQDRSCRILHLLPAHHAIGRTL